MSERKRYSISKRISECERNNKTETITQSERNTLRDEY